MQKKNSDDNLSATAKRLITGNAAEHYFEKNYTSINDFKAFNLKRTTDLACGFDFKLSSNNEFYCVEVKGLSKPSGSIMLTAKEFEMAEMYHKRFCLFVVKNFMEKPFHEYYFNPLSSGLSFKCNEIVVTQVNYTSQV